MTFSSWNCSYLLFCLVSGSFCIDWLQLAMFEISTFLFFKFCAAFLGKLGIFDRVYLKSGPGKGYESKVLLLPPLVCQGPRTALQDGFNMSQVKMTKNNTIGMPQPNSFCNQAFKAGVYTFDSRASDTVLKR